MFKGVEINGSTVPWGPADARCFPGEDLQGSSIEPAKWDQQKEVEGLQKT